MKHLEVQLVQTNYRYGRNAYLPYSVGLLESFCRSSEISNRLNFREAIYLRKPIAEIVSGLKGVSVLGISCYIWNWRHSLSLASEAKKMFPELKIVIGGPQVPDLDTNFLIENSYVDVIVTNEGELVFKNLLEEFLKSEQNLNEIHGIRFLENGKEVRTKPAARIDNLEELPSPYISGVFDNLLGNADIDFQATQETHRGCPYSCSFCDWGSATMSKVRRFSFERITGEYEWFGKNRIDLLYNADANYGLFPEDIDLTRELVKTKEKYGMPTKFRAAYAKNSNDRVFEIATLLENENMCKGVTLSFQSMDSNTLDLIKRKNMKINNFKELITIYRRASIPTYTELIIGLPGETLETFINGIDLLLNAGQHDSLSIYHAMLLTNAEMNSPEYRLLHGIHSQVVPLLLLHGTVEDEDLVEFYEVVTGTLSMPTNKWIDCSIFAWGIQAFHCLNLTQAISAVLKDSFNIDYKDFYVELFHFLENSNSAVGEVFREMRKIALDVANGTGSFDFKDRTFGNIMWPVEEILFLKLIDSDLWTLLEEFLVRNYPNISRTLVFDLIKFQQIFVKQPNDKFFTTHEFNYDLLDYVGNLLLNNEANLVERRVEFEVSDHKNFEDIKDFAREIVWYGRKGSSLRSKLVYKSNPR